MTRGLSVTCSAVLPSNEWRFLQDGRPVRIAIAPRYTTNSAEAGVWHAEQGGGLTMVLAYQALDAIRSGRLVAVLRTFELPARPIHAVYPASRLLSAKVRAFVDLIVETCDWRFSDH